MNKTISINLGGNVFNIEEDAFLQLQQYLNNIKLNFSDDPSGNEIMNDIEIRIAELFQERNNERKNVVTREDIDAVILIMGQPEDYSLDGDTGKNTSGKTGENFGNLKNKKRRIYRDADDAIVSGVCAGLSHYFGWDPLVIRLLVVFLSFISFGTGLLGYLLFWALVPEAQTTTEKLQMRGEPVNIENIGKIVNEETKAATERMKKFGNKASKSFNANTTLVVQGILRVIAVVFSVIIMLFGFALLAGLFMLFALSDFNFFGFDGNNWTMLNTLIFGDDGTLFVLMTGITLAMCAPAIALIYAGIKILTNSTRKIKGLSLTLVSLFIIGFLLCLYGGINTGKQFSRDAEITNTMVFTEFNGDTLQLEVMPDHIFIGRNNYGNEFFDLVKLSGDTVYYGQSLNVGFEPSLNGKFSITNERASQGRNMLEAGKLASDIGYNQEFDTIAGSLLLAPYFTTPAKDKYRGQRMNILIYVPINSYITFGKNTPLICWYAQEGKTMRMTEAGLEDVVPNRKMLPAPPSPPKYPL